MNLLKTALVGATTGLLALSALASPAAAATQTIDFNLYTDKDNSIIVQCPAGTPANVAICAYVKDVPMDASNTAGDKGLTGKVTESYVSALEAPAPVTDQSCAGPAMHTHTAVTVKTSKGDIFMVTDGSFCTVTGHDVEPFKIIGGTGAYTGAGGSGVVNAQQTSPTSATETFTGTLKLAR